MPRSFQDIYDVRATTEVARTEQVATALPPGYQAGGRVYYRNNNFLVDPFQLNVRGRLVTLDEQTEISGDFWNTLRVPSDFYYLYVSQDRVWFVSPTAPVFDEELFAYHHPVVGHRLLGSAYVDASGQMVYATSGLQVKSEEVVLAASDTIGVAWDYLCDGVADEEQLNDAITYLSEAFGGGTVTIAAGTFTTAATVNLKSGVQLRGSGDSCVVAGTAAGSDMFFAAGGAGSELTGIVLENFKVDASALTTADSVTLSLTLGAVLSRMTMVNAPRRHVTLSNADQTKILDSVFVDGSQDAALDYIVLVSSEKCLIARCELYATAELTQNIDVIDMGASGSTRIEDCFFHDFTGDVSIDVIDTGGGFPSTDDSASIRNCTFDTVRAWGTGVVRAIHGNSADRVQVVGCRFFNCGGFEDQATCIGIRIQADEWQVVGNYIERFSGTGIHVVNTANNTLLSGNTVVDCGQLIDRGHCESTTAPMIFGETVPLLVNAGWTRSAVEIDTGSFAYTFSITSTGSAAEAHLVDNNTTTDLHGALAGVEYEASIRLFIPSATGPDETEVRLHLSDHDGGSWAQTTATAAAGDDAWQTLTVKRALRTNAQGFRMFLQILGTAASAEEVYVDNIRLYPSDHQNVHDNCFDDDGVGTISG